ncbi:MAG TPA: flagellar motor switch protein FliG [Bacteroidota bacterium]|jgi:flagellar motor switch protein FliG|nr:flagellar motor switch protein FliG [Bacteroidota bacterium]
MGKIFEKAAKIHSAQQLTGKQKAALLLITLDVDTASELFKLLDPADVEKVTIEIANLPSIPSNVTGQVIEEFYQMMIAREYIIQGGMDYARTLLEKTFGLNRAAEILEKVRVLTQVRGFEGLKKADSSHLANFLQKEHPQTIALILSHLPPDQTAAILTELPDDIRADVVYRIATLGKISPTLLSEVESVVDSLVESGINENIRQTGGTRAVANILNKCNNTVARFLIESIEQQSPDLALEIKRLMFLFEDIIYIDDRGIQRILREIDKKDLALALKVADDKLKDKIFKNMSERAVDLIKEELQFMGPVRLKEVEQAQMRIVDVVKQLEEREEIVIGGRGKSEDVFV